MSEVEPKGFDMGEAFDAIQTKQDEDELLLTEVVEPIEEAPEGPVRDENGRFVAKEPKEAEPVEAVEPVAPVEPDPVPSEPVDPQAVEAPTNMPKAIREAWAALPEGVRDALKTREDETHRLATKVDRERQVGRNFDTMVERYKPLIEQEGGSPLAAVADLLETARVLRQGTPEQKSALINQVCTQFGINIEEAYYARPDPQLAQANIEIMRRDAQLRAYEAQTRAVDDVTVEQQISEFRETHEHFETVAPEMSRLIEAGIAIGLQDAYDRAIYSDETLRSNLIEQAAEKRLSEERAKQAAAVSKAKRASVSPSSASGTAKPPGSENLSQIEAMSLAYDEIAARNTG